MGLLGPQRKISSSLWCPHECADEFSKFSDCCFSFPQHELNMFMWNWIRDRVYINNKVQGHQSLHSHVKLMPVLLWEASPRTRQPETPVLHNIGVTSGKAHSDLYNSQSLSLSFWDYTMCHHDWLLLVFKAPFTLLTSVKLIVYLGQKSTSFVLLLRTHCSPERWPIIFCLTVRRSWVFICVFSYSDWIPSISWLF